jgi:hypothetical protein
MVQARTIANLVHREGEALAACVENKAKTILRCHQFTDEGVPTGETSSYTTQADESVLSQEIISQAGKQLNQSLGEEQQIDVESLQGTCENPATVRALICLDEVRMSRNKKSPVGRKALPPQRRKNE